MGEAGEEGGAEGETEEAGGAEGIADVLGTPRDATLERSGSRLRGDAKCRAET